jgi:hypothetical protein
MNPGSCTLYNIKKDLGLTNTGNYDGYVVVKSVDDKQKVYVTLFDDEYMIYGVEQNNIDKAELQNYSSGDELSANNILSVADCGTYTVKTTTVGYETKTETLSTPQSSTPEVKKLFTGEKEGANNWIGVYEEGNLVACYDGDGDVDTSNGGTTPLNNATKEKNYCTGKVASRDSTTCANAKSTICCSAAADDKSYFESRLDLHTNKIQCGALYVYVQNGWYLFWFDGRGGGALPTSGVYEE